MNEFSRHWLIDPEVVFLNHGSFGACPQPVLAYQQELQQRLEREPADFLARRLESLLDEARELLARFVGADSDDLAFVPNATAGVNTVLRSIQFEPGDEILTTDHEYNACQNVLHYVAERTGARVVVAPIPFPLGSADRVVDALLGRVTPRTRLVLVDHVTSPTGLVFPIERIVRELDRRGIDTLVDGAHAPGMIPLDLRALAPAYYTGNCHKWVCSPKGSALLFVRRDRQNRVRPLVISHGANSPRTDRSPYRLEFDWAGTVDPTAFLCVPEAIRFMGSLLPGGWDELRARNRALALRARKLLCETLGIAPPSPEEMIGSLAAVPLPERTPPEPELPPMSLDPIHHALFEQYRIETLGSVWPKSPQRVLRLSAQIYNDLSQYQKLAQALTVLLAAERTR